MSCSQSWGIVTLAEELMELEKRSSRKVTRWLNPAQMLDHYKVECVVAAIIKDCLKDSAKWRPIAGAEECTDPMAREFK
eukprot:8945913-Alexandrium_andersonii.AAC.1